MSALKNIRLIFVFLFVLLIHLNSKADPLRVEKAFLHDPHQTLTPEQLGQRDFQAFSGELNLGYRSGAVWVRIQLEPGQADPAPGSSPNKPLVFRVGPHQLEQLELFEPSPKGWVVQRSGARWPSKAGPCMDELHCFVLQEPVGTFYLKVVTPTLIKASLLLAPPEEITQQVALGVGKIISAYSLSITLFGIGLLFFWIDRSAILLAYLCLQTMVIFSLITTTGALAEWVPLLSPEQWIDLSYVFLIGRSLAFVVLSRVAIANYQPTSAYVRASGSLVVALVCALLALAFGHVTLALKINLAVTLVNPLLQMHGVWSAKAIPDNFKKILLTAYGCHAVLSCLAGANIFVAAIRFPEIQFLPNISNGTYSGMVIGLLVFWFALAENARLRFLRMEEAQDLRVRIAGAHADEKALKERGALIDMLTHELKNPLGTMRFALASFDDPKASANRLRHMEQSIQRMDKMIEMVALSTKMEMPLAPARQRIELEDFVHRLADGFPDPDRFELHIQPGTWCTADTQLLGIAVENLMSNAYKYSAPGPIHIQAFQDGAGAPAPVRLRFSNGVAPGCEPDEARLFERYYRHPRTSDQAGTGLGLSLVRAALEKMGGRVHYRFSGGLACFEVVLPC